ncbi:MAG: DUF975 family protein [Selenomonadaceae bacterium]|nr:DUF975 family protein [Selenomonadaceae bacterium]
MKTNQEYKNAALAALKGNWATAVVATIIIVVISTMLSLPSTLLSLALTDVSVATAIQGLDMVTLIYVSYGLIFLIICPLAVGAASAFKRLLTSGEGNVTSNMVDDTLSGYWRNVWGMLLMSIFVTLWSLLLVIPGIIKSFSYAMTPYILKDYPELSANQAINLSRKMMKGHKFDLFWLYLSFIGWMVLSLFTLGIGYFWLIPYMYTAQAAFYQDVKKEYLSRD